MGSSANLLKVILSGGLAPTTAGHPRHYGMPPFGQSLTDADIAALASFLRRTWGNDAPAVTPSDVHRVRKESDDRLSASVIP
jgi:mono/diheme cytochrome c family protein